jgi:SulP family sulfate permease
MAGVLLLILGFTGRGSAVKYFPRPVIIGFTNGIAILIASTQIRDFFGLKMDYVPADFFHRMRAYGQSWHTISPLRRRSRSFLSPSWFFNSSMQSESPERSS